MVFTAARGAKALIDAGFTSAYGASEAKLRLGVAVRDEVNAGRIPGPRIRAGGLEISVTGPWAMKARSIIRASAHPLSSMARTPMREAVRFHCREGIDNIKLDVSGDPFYPSTPSTSTTDDLRGGQGRCDTAHAYGRKINAHTRSIDGSKYCIRAGVDGLFHCEHSDEELLDMMEEAKDRHLRRSHRRAVPCDGFRRAAPRAFGLTPEIAGYMGIPDLLIAESVAHPHRTAQARHSPSDRRGLRLRMESAGHAGAMIIAHFMTYYGYSAADALICATRNGGLAMRGDEGDLGTLAAGQLADLILVNGDVLADVSILDPVAAASQW